MSIPLRVLILEDRLSDAELLVHELRQAGFDPAWERVETEADYLAHLDPVLELILSDYSLPQFNGLRALQLVQQRGLDIPFILVSGTIGEEVAVEAMKQGAADYLLKDRLARLGPAVKSALEQRRLRDERKLAEAALWKTESQLRAVLNNAPITIFTTDSHGIFTLSEGKGLENVRLKPGENVGVSAFDLYGSFPFVEYNGKVTTGEDVIRRVLAGEEVTAISELHGVYFDNHIGPLRGTDNKVVGLVGVAIDITERKQAEEALRNAEARYRILFEQSPNGVLLIDLETGRTIEANETARRQLGYTREEFAALRISDYDVLETPEGTARRMQKIIREGSDDFETLHRTKSGEIRNMRVLAKTVQLSDRRFFLAIFQDITERKNAEERIKRQLGRLTALNEIDRMIASSFDLHLSLASIVDRVISQQKVDTADILVMNPDLNILEFGAGHGFHTLGIEQDHLSLGQGYAGRAALERQDIHIPDLRTQVDNTRFRESLAGENFVSYHAVPLIAKGKVKGVLEVFHRSPLDPDLEWLDFLNTLAGQAAIAIDNATLFGNLQRSNMDLAVAYDATIEGWSHALDLRDKETEGHTQRVTEMAVKLAQAMGISDTELVQIRRGALLHDIGKMGVPDDILLKPDKLTDEEWVQMKKHPQFAYDMLAPIAYLKPALDIPYCHHEKWDGTGYPRGLKGEQIPLTARIFAVVDVWDALTSDRPYRKAWTKEKVREHIRTSSGTHFDPQVVETFLWTFEENYPAEKGGST